MTGHICARITSFSISFRENKRHAWFKAVFGCVSPWKRCPVSFAWVCQSYRNRSCSIPPLAADLHPDEKSGTTHNCSKIHEGNADNNSYFHDADIVSYEAQPDASQYPEYIHKILHPTSVSSTGTLLYAFLYKILPNVESFDTIISSLSTSGFSLYRQLLPIL